MTHNDTAAVPDDQQPTVLALFENSSRLVALYEATDAGRSAAETDVAHLRSEALAAWETHQRDVAAGLPPIEELADWEREMLEPVPFPEPNLRIKSIGLRSTPRYAGKASS